MKIGCHATKEILGSLISRDLPHLLRNGSADEVDRLLREVAGPGFSLGELGVEKRDIP